MAFRKKILLLISAMVIILLGITAHHYFSSPDLREIVARSSRNLSSIDTYSYETDINLNAKIKAEYNADLGFHILMKTDVSESSKASHSLGTISIAINNLPYSVSTEQYNVTEDSMPVIYTCTNNIWSKAEGTAYSKFDFSSLKRLLDMIASESLSINSYDLNESVNGKKAYLINVTVSGEVLKDSIAFQAQSLGSSELASQNPVDWDNLSSEFGIYIYKDSLLPAMITISSLELTDLIAENVFPNSEEYGLQNVELVDLSDRVIFSNYNQPLNLTVPENVKASSAVGGNEADSLSAILENLGFPGNEGADAEYSELSPNEDGSYTITSPDTNVSRTIVVPDSVSAHISADTSSIFAANEDYSSTYVYFFTGNSYDSIDALVSSLSNTAQYEESGAEITNYPSLQHIHKEVDVTVITFSYIIKDSSISKSTCYIVVPVENEYFILWIEKDQDALIDEEEIQEAVNNLFVLP